MSSSAITADERVLDVGFSDDALSVSLRGWAGDQCAAGVVSAPTECDSSPAQKLENRRRRVRHPLAGH